MQAFKKQVQRSVHAIAKDAGKLLEEKALSVLANMTEDEIVKLSLGATQPVRLAKSLICAVGDEVEFQYSAEATLREIKSIKRIRRNRYC